MYGFQSLCGFMQHSKLGVMMAYEINPTTSQKAAEGPLWTGSTQEQTSLPQGLCALNILSRQVRIPALGVGGCLPKVVSSLILFVPVVRAFWCPHKGWIIGWVYDVWSFIFYWSVCSPFTMLCQFLLDSKVSQLYRPLSQLTPKGISKSSRAFLFTRQVGISFLFSLCKQAIHVHVQ